MAIITLTRGTYSGANELGQHLAEKLGYKILSRETIIDQLTECGWADEKLHKFRQEKLSILQRMNLEWVHYVACLRAVLSKEAQDEALVYHGNYAQIALRGFPHILSIKVIADMEYRIKAVIERSEHAINEKEAKQAIRKIDKRRDRWAKFVYGTDRSDPSTYDMIIDLSQKSISDAYEMIANTVSQPEFQSTPESRQTIEDLARAADLRARIAMETDVIDDEIEVEVSNGELNIKGCVHSLEDADSLKNFLASHPEIEHVENRLADEPEACENV